MNPILYRRFCPDHRSSQAHDCDRRLPPRASGAQACQRFDRLPLVRGSAIEASRSPTSLRTADVVRAIAYRLKWLAAHRGVLPHRRSTCRFPIRAPRSRYQLCFGRFSEGFSLRRLQKRWDYVRSHLPKSDSFPQVRYQMLHRCAASVIEARRLGFQHAAFVVQAFNTPAKSFQDYAVFCRALKIAAARGSMATTSVDGISLSVGWADCPLATHEEVAATA
jgi:hypothetical protein